MQTITFTFLEFEFPSKNFSLVQLVSTKLSEFFEKFRKKTLRTRGHCALGSPRAGRVFDLVQTRYLLKHEYCYKEKKCTSEYKLELGDRCT
jgi:hypothetical protein